MTKEHLVSEMVRSLERFNDGLNTVVSDFYKGFPTFDKGKINKETDLLKDAAKAMTLNLIAETYNL